MDHGRVHRIGSLSVLAAIPPGRASRSTTCATASKRSIDAYDGTTTFYVFDSEDPIIDAYRRMFPTLFKDASAMPAGLRAHVRYPELLLALQAEVYGLYHMTDPQVFYNREDLWTVATDVAAAAQPDKTAQPMEPNFLLMRLPGERDMEFVEILPFTPANRNNLIGWIAGRSDGEHYGNAVAYDFPKTRLVDGPLQIEARIDQNAQLSGQLSLWNQQGSRVRRGPLLVIPIGRALLYAEAIYLQAERSPMPELRLVVLALQDRLVYAPTFEAALNELFGAAGTSAIAPAPAAVTAVREPLPASASSAEIQKLIAEAAQSLADYQRLTAEGKLGEAGQKLEQLKRTLDELRSAGNASLVELHLRATVECTLARDGPRPPRRSRTGLDGLRSSEAGLLHSLVVFRDQDDRCAAGGDLHRVGNRGLAARRGHRGLQ